MCVHAQIVFPGRPIDLPLNTALLSIVLRLQRRSRSVVHAAGEGAVGGHPPLIDVDGKRIGAVGGKDAHGRPIIDFGGQAALVIPAVEVAVDEESEGSLDAGAVLAVQSDLQCHPAIQRELRVDKKGAQCAVGIVARHVEIPVLAHLQPPARAAAAARPHARQRKGFTTAQLRNCG